MPSTRVDLVTDDACRLYDELILDEQNTIWLIEQNGKIFICPTILDGRPRRAVAGDNFANKLKVGIHGRLENGIHLAASSEKVLDAEQTNESIILDESFIIKWQLVLSDTTSRLKELHLHHHGFLFTPSSIGFMTYDGKLIASAYEYIHNASDGWTWCVQKARENDTGDWIQTLARITSDMHKAFEGSEFAHGDLHVGQFLKANNDFYVIDFEGNPLSQAKESAIADVASLMCSFIHVSAVIDKKYPVEHNNLDWLERVLYTFQYEYEEKSNQLLESDELWSLMLEHEEVEAEYAEKYLPHWKYVAEFGKEYIQGRIHG